MSILKNAIRILTIAELGTRVNPSFLHGALHRPRGHTFLRSGRAFAYCPFMDPAQERNGHERRTAASAGGWRNATYYLTFI